MTLLETDHFGHLTQENCLKFCLRRADGLIFPLYNVFTYIWHFIKYFDLFWPNCSNNHIFLTVWLSYNFSKSHSPFIWTPHFLWIRNAIVSAFSNKLLSIERSPDSVVWSYFFNLAANYKNDKKICQNNQSLSQR